MYLALNKHDYAPLDLVLHTLNLRIFQQLVWLSDFDILSKLSKIFSNFLKYICKNTEKVNFTINLSFPQSSELPF